MKRAKPSLRRNRAWRRTELRLARPRRRRSARRLLGRFPRRRACRPDRFGVLALGAGYALLAPKADVRRRCQSIERSRSEARRDNAALADQVNGDRAAIASLEKRDERARQRRRVKQQRASGTREERGGPGGGRRRDCAQGGAADDAAQRLAAEVKALRADSKRARGEIPDLSARVAKLENEAAKTNGAGADLTALAARVDKIETALAAPKPETRAAPEKPSAADNAAAIAIITGAIADKAQRGRVIGPELAELERLGVEPAKLAPLRPWPNGGADQLRARRIFHAVAPKVLAATPRKGSRGRR